MKVWIVFNGFEECIVGVFSSYEKAKQCADLQFRGDQPWIQIDEWEVK